MQVARSRPLRYTCELRHDHKAGCVRLTSACTHLSPCAAYKTVASKTKRQIEIATIDVIKRINSFLIIFHGNCLFESKRLKSTDRYHTKTLNVHLSISGHYRVTGCRVRQVSSDAHERMVFKAKGYRTNSGWHHVVTKCLLRVKTYEYHFIKLT